MISQNAPDTPLKDLLPRVAAAPFLIVKERNDELDKIRTDKKIQITLDCTNHKFLFSCNPETGNITVGLTALERIWCYCYAFHFAHSWRAVHPLENDFDSSKHPELRPAFQLLQKVRESEKNNSPVDWTEELPRPDRHVDEPAIQNAGGLLIYTVSFILLHEIAHIYLGHPLMSPGLLPSESIQQEYEADGWAAEFTLEKWREHNPAPNEFINRANGIAVGLALLASVELETRPGTKRDHPIVPDRLLSFFSKHIPDTDAEKADLTEFPKYFASIILFTLLQQRGVDFDYSKIQANFFDLLVDIRSLFG